MTGFSFELFLFFVLICIALLSFASLSYRGVNILNAAHSIASNLSSLPTSYAQFYGQRAQAILTQATNGNKQ